MADTGFPAADAEHDFLRARRRQIRAQLVARLRGQPDDVSDVLPFDEVVAALGRTGEQHRGLCVVAVDTIVGSVDRPRDFDRSFRPRSGRSRERWERLARAYRRGEAIPPVPLPPGAPARITVEDPWSYAELSETVEAWGFRLMQLEGRFLSRHAVAQRWWTEEYQPVLELLRGADLIGRSTEAEAYLETDGRRYRLMRTHRWDDDVLVRLREDG